MDKLEEMYDSNTFPDITKLSHTLKFKNCASVDFKNNRQKISYNDFNGYKERAVSFTVIALKVDIPWDMGVGFDNTNDVWVEGKNVVSKDGCTWFNATTENTWNNDGIYNEDFIQSQYEEYLRNEKEGLSNKGNIVIGYQKFDIGNENFSIDITDYVNDLISGEEENNGICLLFSPFLEEKDRNVTQYVGFFNEKTNTIFTPVLESRYDENIEDNRFSFYLNKRNKLYLYSIIGGKFENLDEIPNCTIDDIDYPVFQEGKGVYYVVVTLNDKQYSPNQIIYDIWSNIKYHGEEMDNIELEFVTHSQKNFFSIDETIRNPKILTPFLVGINNNEKIVRGEVRMCKLFFRVPYTHSDYILNDTAEYRVYVKDGNREVTIIDWDKILNISKCGLFYLDTETLCPAEYHIDIRAYFGDESRVFKNETTFRIVSDTTDQDR